MDTWDLTLSRTELTDVAVTPAEPREPGQGEAVLRVDRVGMTANNVTYALLGETLRYWQFFPAADPARGRVPLWGFAEVVTSRADGVAVGDRVYGYLPSSSHLLVRPDHVRAGGFRDAAPHRADLPAVYNAYAPAIEEQVDLQVLFRPLFMTSWMLADWLTDGGPAAPVVVLSSASSKTAYGTAAALADVDVRVVGLTSEGNVDFTRGLGVYDEVLPYGEVRSLASSERTAYVDVAGSAPLRREVHEHLGDALVRDVVVGLAQGPSTDASVAPDTAGLPGPSPTLFFAPDQIAKRQADWGPGGLEQRFAAAWASFTAQAVEWVDVVEGAGPDGLRDAWLAVLDGVGPREGHVVQL